MPHVDLLRIGALSVRLQPAFDGVSLAAALTLLGLLLGLVMRSQGGSRWGALRGAAPPLVIGLLAVFMDSWVLLLLLWNTLLFLGRGARLTSRISLVSLLFGLVILYFGMAGSFSGKGRGFLLDRDPARQAAHLGPTASFSEMAARLALPDDGLGRPVAEGLHHKLFFGVPLPLFAGALFVLFLALQGAAFLSSRGRQDPSARLVGLGLTFYVWARLVLVCAPLLKSARTLLLCLGAVLFAGCFDPDHSIRDGDHGMQWVVRGLFGLNGLSLPLIGLSAALLPLSLLGGVRPPPRQAAWSTLATLAALVALYSLNVLVLMGSMAALLFSLRPLLPGGQRRSFSIAALAALLSISVFIVTIYTYSTERTLDLIGLSYGNYYGNQVVLGLTLSRLGAGLLIMGAIAPLLLTPLPSPGCLLAPIAALGLYLRLCAGVVPDGAVSLAPLTGALGLGVLLLGAARGDATRAQLGLCLLGLSSFTQSGIMGSILLIICHGILICAGRAKALLPLGPFLFLPQLLVLIGSFPAHRLLTLGAGVALAVLAARMAMREGAHVPLASEQAAAPSGRAAPRPLSAALHPPRRDLRERPHLAHHGTPRSGRHCATQHTRDHGQTPQFPAK